MTFHIVRPTDKRRHLAPALGPPMATSPLARSLAHSHPLTSEEDTAMATELLRIRDSTTTSIRDPSTWTRVLDTPLLQTHAADSNANSNLDSVLAAATTPAAVAALGGGDELSVFRVPALEQLIAVAPIGAFAPANNGGFVPLGEDASSSSSGAEGVESAQLGAPRRRVAKKRWYAVQKVRVECLRVINTARCGAYLSSYLPSSHANTLCGCRAGQEECAGAGTVEATSSESAVRGLGAAPRGDAAGAAAEERGATASDLGAAAARRSSAVCHHRLLGALSVYHLLRCALLSLRGREWEWDPHRGYGSLLLPSTQSHTHSHVISLSSRYSPDGMYWYVRHQIAQRPPFEKYIHLPLHCADRVATLINMKDSVLRDAERYLAERKRFLGSTMKYSHAEKFELPNGDYCYTGFDSFPLEGVASVRQAFDAIRHYFFNMEITYTEMSGEVMVRESDYDETGDSDVTAHRFVRSTSAGTQVEANSVLFSAYREASSPQQREHRDDGSVGDSATISVDFVNTDERFPYASSQRVRQDTTAAISVTAYPRSRRGNTSIGGGGGSVGDGASRSSSNANRGGGGDASSPASGDFVVMFTRSYFAHLHRSPELGLPSDAVTGIGFISDFCFTTLIKSLYETAKSTPPLQSAAEEAGF